MHITVIALELFFLHKESNHCTLANVTISHSLHGTVQKHKRGGTCTKLEFKHRNTCFATNVQLYQDADKSLARPGRKQATATKL